MKKTTPLLLFLLLVFCFGVQAQTSGKLSVLTTTSKTALEKQAPKHILAIWIQDDLGNFVKTMLAYADIRIEYLYTWGAITSTYGSKYNTVDALSGATRKNHGIRYCTWDGTDVSGSLVSDGTYHLYMELTDYHGQGNVSTFSFVKGTSTDSLNPADESSFSSISLKWEPIISSIEENSMDLLNAKEIVVYPNPATNGTINIELPNKDFEKITISNIQGKVGLQMSVQNKDKATLDISTLASGIYFVNAASNNVSITKKIIVQ